MKKPLAAVVTAFLICGTIAAAPTATASTKIVKYSAKGMTVTGHVTGSCWTTSIAAWTRPDAYRCMAGNAIHDPCFIIAAHSVGCPQDVFANSGIVMKLDKPLPTPMPAAASPEPSAHVWAMLLQSGEKCSRGTGTIVPDFPFYCSGPQGVCAAPNLAASPAPAYFVKCASIVDGKPKNVSSTLVKTIYE